MIKAIFLDAGNTLFRPYPSVGSVYARVARRHGAKVRPDVIQERFARVWAHRSGTVSPHGEQEEHAWWKELVGEVFEGDFRDTTVFDAFFNELHHVFAQPDTWRLYPDSLSTLAKLKRNGLTVGIVSNWDKRLFALCDGLGVTPRVDFILASAVEKTAKPERAIFQRALRRAGVRAGEALHAGDSFREDYRGAVDAGLSARLLCREGKFKKGATCIKSLTELAAI